MKILEYQQLDYTDGQIEMLSKIETELRLFNTTKSSGKELRVSGVAGSGKTSVIKNIVMFARQYCSFSSYHVLAPTNKAVQVLVSKMVDIDKSFFSTIHSTIYGSPEDKVAMTWTIKDYINRAFVVIDEASLIDKAIKEDIDECFVNSFIIYIGDGFQLEPVGTDIKLLKNPDILLTEVKRNAGDILNYSIKLRTEYKLADYSEFLSIKKVSFLNAIDLFSKDVREGLDVIYIVATNKVRVDVNNKTRNRVFNNTGVPQIQERLIAIANSAYFANGELFEIETINIHTDRIITFADRFKTVDERVIFCTINELPVLILPNTESASFQPYAFSNLDYESELLPLVGEENIVFDETGRFPQLAKRVTIATYGYATSCHKSQGSQWNKVYVDQNYLPALGRGWDNVRWRYTAITRAVNELVIVNRN